jgi:FkbM family methyltransferase
VPGKGDDVSDTRKAGTRFVLLMTILGIMVGLFLGKSIFKAKSEPELPPQEGGPRTELDRYSPNHFSGNNEEIIIRHYFKDRRNGYFLDVGSYHYSIGSNTYYLEKYLGWEGIAIDANEEYALGYKENRPKTLFFSLFVSDRSDESIDFYIVQDPRHPAMSTAVPSFIQGLRTKKVSVPTISLNDLLSRLGVHKIDFVTIDIELWEPRALAGFDIIKYRPDLVCIEAHHQVRDEIFDYFTLNHYRRLDQYFLFDQKNWYFVPEDVFKKVFDTQF